MPFVIDRCSFTFTPRTQRINDLEAVSRIRLHFNDRVFAFWKYQGVELRLPVFCQKLLDLFHLHKAVVNNRGFEQCCQNRMWGTISSKLGYHSK